MLQYGTIYPAAFLLPRSSSNGIIATSHRQFRRSYDIHYTQANTYHKIVLHLSRSSSEDTNDDIDYETIRPSKRRSRKKKSPSADAATESKSNMSSVGNRSTRRSKQKQHQHTGKNLRRRTSLTSTTSPASATMSTALCIVPPDDAWDTIQRARHLARDTSFYKWPPAIRLFHPFAPKREIPNLVGQLAEWIEDEMGSGDDEELIASLDMEDSMLMSDEDVLSLQQGTPTSSSSATYLQSFTITLSTIQILPHFEILDARLEALKERSPQTYSMGFSKHERETQKRRAEGQRLIDEEERKGLERKRERERKRRLKREMKERELDGTAMKDDENDATTTSNGHKDQNKSVKQNVGEEEGQDEDSETNGKSKGNKYNGPCVIYLCPNNESQQRLNALREHLRSDLFSMYDAFSPSSSVSPYPEVLPRKARKSTTNNAVEEKASVSFRPLLPIARFPNVDAAVKVAKILQQTWDPLTFNVTDLQFISREDDSNGSAMRNNDPGGIHMDMDIPEVRHRSKHGTLHPTSSSLPSSSATSLTKDRMALTSSGEVEDVSKQGIYGCDAMVMLWGEEPSEDIMDEEASLSMIMDDEEEMVDGKVEEALDDTGSITTTIQRSDQRDAITGKINYNDIFATAEREYQRMLTHEELSNERVDVSSGLFDSGTNDIEAWLDDDDDMMDDEGATVVIGRAQFFMGAMREFIGMPASSAIDLKDRIMGGGINAVARRKGSVHRLAESWDVGDYGKKDSDYR